MNRPQIWKVAGVILLVFGLQLFCGLQLYAQHADLGAAAAAKAAAGREALTHGASNASDPVGTFITFDVPGAVNGTSPSGMNQEGAITGSYYDANFLGHGFLRDSNGGFTTFDAPGAVAAMIGTFPLDINPEAAITGDFFDANFVPHGFLRASDGALTTFDAPGAATTGFPSGTTPVGINPKGVITGSYADANNADHGFLRARDGIFSTFDPPGEIRTFAPFSFGPDLSMNPEGVITGTYFELISGNPFGGNFRVFVRAKDGTFTTFDAATYPPCCIWSFPSAVSPKGTLTGSFNDGHTINHGFLRAPDGTVTTFDVPGAGTGFDQGTVPLGIDPAGEIMGFYRDANGVSHGFLLLPRP